MIMLINEEYINSKIIDEYKELLSNRLNENRYYHSLCVAEEARRLACIYGADQNNAYLAGLLHDITKNASTEEHLKIFDTFDIILTDVEKSSIKLWHAISGAAYVEHFLCVDDKEVIDSIRYHTTAREKMTLLDTVIYLADFTSADRDYQDVDVMRSLVDKSKNEALNYALKYTIQELIEKGAAIHPDTISAYNSVVLKGKDI